MSFDKIGRADDHGRLPARFGINGSGDKDSAPSAGGLHNASRHVLEPAGMLKGLIAVARSRQSARNERDSAVNHDVPGAASGALPRGPQRVAEALAAARAKGRAVYAGQPESKNLAGRAKSVARRSGVTFVDHLLSTSAIPALALRARGPEALRYIRAAGAVDIAHWERIPGTQRGSKAGGLFRHPECGDLIYAKFYASPDQPPCELAFLQMYRNAGFDTVDAQLVTIGSRLGIATRWRNDLLVGSAQAFNDADPRELAGIYQLSVLVDNADFLGLFDNIGYSKETGRVVVIDAGASMRARSLLRFRLRPDMSVRWFAEDERYRRVLTRVTQLYDPLLARDPELAAHGARSILPLTNDTIERTFDLATVRPRLARQIVGRLQTRRDVMLARYGLELPR